jgi:glycosyltransferase involved in cell wall biosynthesis
MNYLSNKTLEVKISIITATYNSGKTIESAVQSVLSQSYPNIEHLIIDGASRDNTVELITKYQQDHPNLRLISEPDKGIYDALNKGVQLATGDIIGFLHSDDFFENATIIEQIVNTMLEHNNDGVYGDLKYVSAENPEKTIRFWKSRPFKVSLLKKGWMPAHPTLFLKRRVYQKHGHFDLDFKIAADYDFMLRILKDDTLKFTYLPTVVTRMRVGGASNALGNIRQKMKEDLKALKKNQFGGISTLARKNLSKISQFLVKKA